MANHNPALYPLRFQEILRNYGFGDRWMAEAFCKDGLPEGHTLAETWEVVDRPGESGRIINGALQGMTLHDCIATYGEALLGSDMLARFGTRFPLLIKFLDASKPLGEQIHPNDDQAPAYSATDTGKTEAWYMLKVRPGSTVHLGNRPGVTREELAEALLRQDSLSCMEEHRVQPGDAFLLYAGTMHYCRGGVLFCEIMQNSDVTLGLKYAIQRAEPDRRPEESRKLAGLIHLEDDFDCQTTPLVLREGPNTRTFVMACKHFAMERLDLAAPREFKLDGKRFYVLSLVEGTARVIYGDHTEELRLGQSCLLPASLGSVRLEPHHTASLLAMYVPDLLANIITPLRERGIADAAIVALGGRTRLNDLAGLV